MAQGVRFVAASLIWILPFVDVFALFGERPGLGHERTYTRTAWATPIHEHIADESEIGRGSRRVPGH